MNKDKYSELYDTILFYLWDKTTGCAMNQREAYKGAKLYGRFLISEIERIEKLKANGEAAIVRRGLAPSNFLLTSWAYNILEECLMYRVPPPDELCRAIYHFMGCSHLSGNRGKPEARKKFEALKRQHPQMSLRKIAREVGVNPTTALRWSNSPNYPETFDQETYTALRKLMSVDDFYPMRYRVLRKKMREQHE